MSFIVLGDAPEYSSIAAACIRYGWVRSHNHSSGRPWLVHSPGILAPQREIIGDRQRIAVVGPSIIAGTDIEDALARASTFEEALALRRYVIGDYHFLASLNIGTLQAGSISRTRRLCRAYVRGLVVFSDSAALLSELGDFQIDLELVTAWTLTSYPPHPLDDIPLWKGIYATTPGYAEFLDRHGALTQRAYWMPPLPEVEDARLAGESVRTALSDAVRARAVSYASVSSDLSGGLDSTSLTYLLNEHASDFETFHCLSEDVLNDDASWADYSAARLGGVRHRTIPNNDSPAWYGAVANRDYSRDSPDPMARTQAKSEFLHLLSEGRTPHARLNGTGGDELFTMDVLAMHYFLMRDPSRARTAFEEFVYARHDAPRTVKRRMARDPNRLITYERWYSRLVDSLSSAPDRWSLGWECGTSLAPWVSHDARSVLKAIFQTSKYFDGTISPISAHKPFHEILKLIRIGGDVTRRMSALAANSGVFIESPFLDERVVYAALQAAPQLHIRKGAYKPLLVAAMRDTLPNALLVRNTKGGYNRELYRGLSENRSTLLELFGQSSRAAALDLIDRKMVVSAVRSIPTDVSMFRMFDSVIGIELWLRDVETPRFPSLKKELMR